MKKTAIIALILLCSFISVNAQKGSGIGIKMGLNYGANGDFFDSATENYENPNGNFGLHVGVFGKIGNKIYFRPELVYTKTNSDYENNNFILEKLDAPLLIGYKVIGPVSIFAGPSLQYILDSDYGQVTVDDIKNDFSVGFNFGVGVNIKDFGVDLRYERGFSENEATLINNNIEMSVDRLDTRPEQLILSLSYKL